MNKQPARYIAHSEDYEDLDLRAARIRILNTLQHEIQRANFHHARASDRTSVYVGAAGSVVTNWRVSALNISTIELTSICKAADDALTRALNYSPTVSPREGSKTSFLETSVGPATLALLKLLSTRGNHDLFKTEAYYTCMHILRSAVQVALKTETPAEDGCEVLYGRAGLLYALLLLRSGLRKCQIGLQSFNGRPDDRIFHQLQDLVSDSTLRTFVEDIVKRGEIGAKKLSSHIRSSGLPTPLLMWSWYGKMYLGAAHGVAGILQMLVSCPASVISPFLPSILTTAEWLVNRQDNNGNWPTKANYEPSSDRARDTLVQWCHGATGIIIFLTTLLRRSRDLNVPSSFQEKIKHCIVRSTELIYKRGLLVKGVGLCHGVAGSIFALLSASDVMDSDDRLPLFFLKAVHLAVLATRWRKMTEKGEMKVPDRPYSLYEGLAGVCVAWTAILERLSPDGKWQRGLLGMPGFDDLERIL